jgi:hypothetical protein
MSDGLALKRPVEKVTTSLFLILTRWYPTGSRPLRNVGGIRARRQCHFPSFLAVDSLTPFHFSLSLSEAEPVVGMRHQFLVFSV